MASVSRSEIRNQMASVNQEQKKALLSGSPSAIAQANTQAKNLSGVVSSTQNPIANVVSDLTKSISGSISGASGLGNLSNLADGALSSFQSQIGNLSGGNLLGDISSQLTSKFPGVGDLFGESPVGKLTNVVPEAYKGTQETNTKINSLTADESAAITNPVAFVTQPLNSMVSNIAQTASAINIPDIGNFLSGESLSDMSAALGSNFNPSNILDSITSVTNSLNGAISGATGFVTNNLLGPVTSSLSSFSGNITDSLKSVTSVIGSGSLVSINGSDGLLNFDSISDSLLNVLPDPVKGFISVFDTSAIAKDINSFLSEKVSSAAHFTRLLGDIADGADVLNMITSLTGNYNKLVNGDGTGVEFLFGKNKSSAINTLYDIGGMVCDKINRPSVSDFSNNKDLFDLLLKIANDMGINDLIDQLSSCEKFFDSRSKNVLLNGITSAAAAGNVHTVQSITKAVGTSNISNAKNILTQTNANMKLNYSTDDEKDLSKSKVSTYNNLLQANHLTVNKLIEDDNELVIGGSKVQVLDANKVTVMSASNTEIVDAAIGSNLRKLVQASTLITPSSTTSKADALSAVTTPGRTSSGNSYRTTIDTTPTRTIVNAPVYITGAEIANGSGNIVYKGGSTNLSRFDTGVGKDTGTKMNIFS